MQALRDLMLGVRYLRWPALTECDSFSGLGLLFSLPLRLALSLSADALAADAGTEATPCRLCSWLLTP
jgi:hypothetical protein